MFTYLFGKRGRGSSRRRKQSTAFLSNVLQPLICLVALLEQSRDSKLRRSFPRVLEPGKDLGGRQQTGPAQVERSALRTEYGTVG